MSPRRRLASLLAAAALAALSLSPAPSVAGPGLTIEEIAPGVFVHQGAYAQTNPSNHGDIANIGFIIGGRCVAVIDTGGSPRVGRALLGAVRRRTDKPVCYVINTHMHPDHVLGNAAFEGGGTVFIAHHRMPRALASRQRSYRNSQAQALGRSVPKDWFVYPDRTVDDRTRIQLGGRELILQAHPTAHTSNDLTVRDPDTGTWWLGDLLFVDRMPTLDGSLTGWRKVLDRLDDRAAKRVVPGHGPPAVAWPKAARPLEAYLKDLEQQVRSALDQGQTLTDVVLAAQRREDPDWALFKRVHPRNVSKAYTELEWQ